MADAAPLSIELVHDRRLCYAMQQNRVPLLQLLRLGNLGEQPLHDLEVTVRLEPDLAAPCLARIAAIPGRGTYNLTGLQFEPRPEALANATERQVAALRVEVHSAGRLLASSDANVEVLAYNEWPGAASLPALLAAFVLPNHPALAPVLRAAADRLGQATGRAGLDGYQSRDRGRAAAIAQAVFEALQARGLAYVHPPASFEQTGQKVRTPEQVLHEGLATCVDLAVVYAACLEQAGLHPLLLVLDGHALAGVWLEDEVFPEPAPADPLPLRKRQALGRLLLVECTALCATLEQPFAAATRLGARAVEEGSAFLHAVDVVAARRAGIRPLPVRTTAFQPEPPERTPVAAPDAAPDATPAAAELLPIPAAPEQRREPAAADRLQRWQRRLLDLSLRNRLLNFVASKRTLPLSVTDLGGLQDALEAGGQFRLLPEPPPRSGEDETTRAALVQEELRSRRLFSPLAAEELERRQLEIWRQARLAEEESGVSTLFLALGFLRWFETPASQEPRRAPLLLLPLRLERVSLAEGFALVLADEEARINDTLLQKLQHDFGIEVPPVADDENGGIQIAAVLDAFRAAVLDVARWEVEATASIGSFSFAKYLMWVDLEERRADLMQHPFLQHLVATPGAAFAQPGPWPEPGELDQRDPAGSFCPKDADSSQLCAVLAAAQGRSFVLEGPPGTGKSQTITNLIAQCLAQGQRVLFVAEKRAALEVVQRRLAEVGLSPFCLELHSGRGSKRDVVQQLGRALEVARAAEPAQWRQRAAELQQIRDRLNGHVTAIHRRRECGLSVFAAMATAVAGRELPLVTGLPTALDAEQLQNCRQLVEALAATASPLGPLHLLPWHGVRRTDWTLALPRELEPLLAEYGVAVAAAVAASSAVGAVLGIADAASCDRDRYEAIALLCQQLAAGPLPAALLCAPDFALRAATLRDCIGRGRRRAELWAQLAGRWREDLLVLDVVALRLQLLQHEPRLWPWRWWRLRPVHRALRAVALDGRGPRGTQLHEDLAAAAEVRELDDGLRAAEITARESLGVLWRGSASDWEQLAQVVERAASVRQLAAAIAPGKDLAPLLVAAVDLAAAAAEGLPAAQPLQELIAAAHRFDAAGTALARPLQLDWQRAAAGPGTAVGFLPRAQEQAARWAQELPRLREHCAVQRDLQAVEAAGLGAVAAALERGEVEAANLPAVFERSFAVAWLEAVMQQEPALASFRGPDHERAIARFCALDRELIALAGQVVLARLCAGLPSLRSTTAESSELGILLRELKKQRRHLPARQLFARIPNLLGRLAPCLLMSPLTVAQVLGRGVPPFDVVVFDEASQVPVWDAVGAIGRGRALVVVGDSRQLPPTAFFQRLGDEDDARDEFDGVEELESVLDECGAAGLQRLDLRWHYRSRHESLIAFSNHHYYDNRLFTFPAPDPRAAGLGVRLIAIDGVYDRARSQTNRAEAEALVQELLRRLLDPATAGLRYGVVTFSQAQQVLVEDLLELLRREHPAIEQHFTGSDEPLFVKNLENVQGDERDVMLFSICYGPDAAGKVHMNFGPLNQQGGERRLNVAVTRARSELLVFSSLRAEQIDLSRTQSLGVRHLRTFLDYAARGPAAIAEAVALDPSRDCESPFEREVRAALQRRGHEVHAQVGCSGYRIDLAVVDPRQEGRYLLGIECDGRTYHQASTARDRDRLRQGVLEQLGWTLARVWSTDWWLDQAGETARLERAIAAALQRPLPSAPAVAVPAISSERGKAPLLRFLAGGAAAPPGPQEPAPPAGSPTGSPGPSAGPSAGPPEGLPEGLPRYQVAAIAGGPTEAFHETRGYRSLVAQVAEVLGTEGPIAFDLLVRRCVAAWGLGRTTDRVRERVRSALPKTVVQRADVLWPAGLDPDSYSVFRVPEPGDEAARRDGDELPVVEVANAMAWLLGQHGSLGEDDLLREAARLFGWSRLGSALQRAMRAGLSALQERGGAIVEQGVVRASGP